MLGRLFKHEFKSYGLAMGIIFLAGGLMTIFMKILSMLPYGDNAKDGIQMLMVVGFILVVILMSVAVNVMIVVRFYSTTVCDQAYLTWTLPAKTSTVLMSKLFGGLLWRLILIAAVAILGVIFFSGSYWLWHEEFSGMFFYDELTPGMIINELLKQFSGSVTSKDIASFVIYYVGVLIWSVAGILLIYMCIGIGQLFGKFRVVASIGFYFLTIIVIQVISTIGVSLLPMVYNDSNGMNSSFGGRYDFLPGVINLVAAIVVSVAVFAITNNLFDKHLNLD